MSKSINQNLDNLSNRLEQKQIELTGQIESADKLGFQMEVKHLRKQKEIIGAIKDAINTINSDDDTSFEVHLNLLD